MNLEELALNDANSNKNMMDDPNWTAQERQQYQAAYTFAKNKQNNQ